MKEKNTEVEWDGKDKCPEVVVRTAIAEIPHHTILNDIWDYFHSQQNLETVNDFPILFMCYLGLLPHKILNSK